MDPDYKDLYARGKSIREHVLGSEHIKKEIADPTAFGAGFQELTTAIAWGGVWHREGLGLRDRSLLAVVLLAALGRPGELTMHLPGALRNGVTIKELEEAFIHMGLYAGFPATVAANRVAREVLGKK